MLKVLLVHNYYQQAGGEDQVVADEAWLLEQHGCQVLRYHRHNDEVAELGRAQTARATLWSRQSYRELQTLIKRERPDVMHCHNLFPLISPAAWRAARDAGVPVVQTLHNFRWLCAGGAFLRDGKPCEDCLGKLPLAAVRHACYRGSRAGTAVVAAMQVWHRWRGSLGWVDRFIALSQFSRQKFIAGGLPAERLVVKPNFLTAEVEPGEGRGRNALFVGRLSEEKGVELLLAAWKQLAAPMRLTIVGDGPLAPLVEAAAKEDSRITWLGRLSPADVYAQIREAACLLLPSTCYENFPKTLVEAYAHGTPVIAAGHGSLRELVAPGNNGFLFRAGDAGDLAATVTSFPANAADRLRLRTRARETYLNRFTSAENWRQLRNIYRSVLAHPEKALADQDSSTASLALATAFKEGTP
jgi:glycosyltransferase involved in cell wall biosynthesis